MRLSSFHLPRKNRRILLLFLAVFLLGLAICVRLSSILFSALSYAEPTPVFVNHVAEEVHGLTQLWSRDDVYILQKNKTLDVSMGVSCFVGNLGETIKYDHLTCFEDETGEILWKREEAATDGLLAVTPQGVFITDITNISGANTLSKYDLQTGNLIWQKRWFDSNPTGLQFFDNQIQLITWKPGRDLWIYDTDGKVLKKINNTDAVLITSDITYVSATGLQAVKTDTNEVLWKHKDTAYMHLFTQDKIFSRSESNSGMVYALDRATGELLWQVGNIVYSSNIAHSPEKQRVYALRNNGDLLAINANTGETSIAVKFSSTPFLPNIAGIAQAYELAYDQETHILLVSLGDGHQLFAFREE